MPAFASVVHDLRNPLSTIYGSAELLISADLSEQQIRRLARNMYGASVRVKELLDELLSRYRRTDGDMELSNLRELIVNAVDKIAMLAEAQSVRLVQNLPATLIIAVDRRRIERVFVNLFINALDVMPNGGTIRVSAVPVDDSVVIKVRDTGPGIAPEIRDRLFEPFATAGKTQGLGLGLALSRQAVMDHGGRMWADSSQQGACFAVRLPRLVNSTLTVSR